MGSKTTPHKTKATLLSPDGLAARNLTDAMFADRLRVDLVPAAMIVMTAVTVIAVPVVTVPVAAAVPVTITVPTDYDDRRANIHSRRRCIDDRRRRRCIDRLR